MRTFKHLDPRRVGYIPWATADCKNIRQPMEGYATVMADERVNDADRASLRLSNTWVEIDAAPRGAARTSCRKAEQVVADRADQRLAVAQPAGDDLRLAAQRQARQVRRSSRADVAKLRLPPLAFPWSDLHVDRLGSNGCRVQVHAAPGGRGSSHRGAAYPCSQSPRGSRVTFRTKGNDVRMFPETDAAA